MRFHRVSLAYWTVLCLWCVFNLELLNTFKIWWCNIGTGSLPYWLTGSLAHWLGSVHRGYFTMLFSVELMDLWIPGYIIILYGVYSYYFIICNLLFNEKKSYSVISSIKICLTIKQNCNIFLRINIMHSA